MKLSTAVLAAGAAVCLATAAVGAARLRQDAQHQAEKNEATVARNQLDWLAQMSTNPDLAKLWAHKDMDVQECMRLLEANQLIYTVSLRDSFGFIRDGQLPFFASMVINSDVYRRYWARASAFAPRRPKETSARSTSPESWKPRSASIRTLSPQRFDRPRLPDRFQFSGAALRSCRRRTCGTPSAALPEPHTSKRR